MINIKNKLINHLTRNGRKEVSENILLKSIKKLQKNTTKKSSKVIQLSLKNSTPIFKVCKFKNKRRRKIKTKEIPVFIKTKIPRISLAIKLIILNIKKKEKTFYKKLTDEMILNSKNKGLSINKKNNLQEQATTKDHYLRFFKW